MISIRDLSFSYRNAFTLKIDKMDILENRLYVIIGPNGSGKTTLAKILSGLIYNYKGSVEIDGFNIKNLKVREKGRLISYMHKRIINDFTISVYKFIEMGRYVHQNRLFLSLNEKDSKLISEVLDIVDLQSKKNNFLSELSDGELQRACIAKVLCQKTKYAVLDEPTSNLDLKHTSEILKLLENLKHKTTFIVILHNLNEAIKIYDRLIGMKCGKINFIWENQSEFNLKKLENLFTIKLKLLNDELGKVVYF